MEEGGIRGVGVRKRSEGKGDGWKRRKQESRRRREGVCGGWEGRKKGSKVGGGVRACVVDGKEENEMQGKRTCKSGVDGREKNRSRSGRENEKKEKLVREENGSRGRVVGHARLTYGDVGAIRCSYEWP